MRSSLKITGLKESVHRVDEVGERARRPEPALRASGTRMDLQMSERRRFTTYRFRPASREWVERKRREGLSTKTMIASGRLSSALMNAETGTTRLTVYNGVLTWGLRMGPPGTPGFYARVQAMRGRKSVVIDKRAKTSIAERVEGFLAHGFVR